MMSKELAKSYNPKDFEDRIYKYWNDSRAVSKLKLMKTKSRILLLYRRRI